MTHGDDRVKAAPVIGAAASEQVQWRGLDALGRPFRRGHIEAERETGVLGPELDRRQFFRLAGTSLAIAGLPGCGPVPEEEVLPYVDAPENVVPGQSLFYASALPLDGYARGVLVETVMGRPIKVEGNPNHPASLGATDIYAQAAVLDLWDPDRSQTVLHEGQPAAWTDLIAALAGQGAQARTAGRRGLAVLTGTCTSPTLAGQLDSLLERLPEARWYRDAPAGEAESLTATRAAFGEALLPRADLRQATVILALDADPLGPGPDQVGYARAFADARDPDGSGTYPTGAAPPTS
jgi:hypothetical protein